MPSEPVNMVAVPLDLLRRVLDQAEQDSLSTIPDDPSNEWTFPKDHAGDQKRIDQLREIAGLIPMTSHKEG